MANSNKVMVGLWLMVMAVVLILPAMEAITCDVTELRPCEAALKSGQQPSSACCVKLRAQRPCLCESSDPIKQFDSPYISYSGRIADACRVRPCDNAH